MDVITYQCPNCGAPLTFHSDTGKWDCEFCNSSFTKEMIDEADQKREPAFQPEPEPEEPDAAGLRRYTCPQCGAEIITDATTAATFCVFCQNPAIMVSQLSGDFRPQKIIPFRNTREEAVAAFRRHCRRKPLLPRDFVCEGLLDEESQRRMYKAVAKKYCAGGPLFIKAHPRDAADYKALFPDAVVLERTMPSEVLNFALPFRFARAVTVESTVLKAFGAADEKVSLPLDEALALAEA